MKRYLLGFAALVLLASSSCGGQSPTTAADPTTVQTSGGTPSAIPGNLPAQVAFTDSGQRLGSAQSWDIALGDLDQDGDLDAFVANAIQGGIKNMVWLNDGQGSFKKGQQDLGYGQSVALADLDGDSDLDALVTNWWGEESSQAWFNDGTGRFTEGGQDLGSAFRSALGDLNGDGARDVIMARMGANSVWLNDGSGLFADTAKRLGTAITAAIALGDLDGDGDLDALAGGWEEPAKVWLNDGAAMLSQHEQQLCPASVHIHGLALGDVDGDVDLDVFMAVASGDPNQVWLNDGSGGFSNSGQELRSSLAQGVALGDLDGDGDLDAVTAHGTMSGSSGGRFWLNNGEGYFTAGGLRMGNLPATTVALGDLDGDGDLDVFVAHGETWQESGGGIPNEVWLNELL